jgi:uncharacterized protein (DUF433 family)
MAATTTSEFPPLVVPLTRDSYGVLRVGGTRVSLDSVIYDHLRGSTPEQIVENFPSLRLEDIYAVVGYYVAHRTEIDAYLLAQEAEDERIRAEWEAGWDREAFRKKVMERKAAQEAGNGAPGD